VPAPPAEATAAYSQPAPAQAYAPSGPVPGYNQSGPIPAYTGAYTTGYPPGYAGQPAQSAPPAQAEGQALTERIQKGLGQAQQKAGEIAHQVGQTIEDEPFWTKALRWAGMAAFGLGVIGGLVGFISVLAMDTNVPYYGDVMGGFTKFLLALGLLLVSVVGGAVILTVTMVLANLTEDIDAIRKAQTGTTH
jgi:hypothetical protein